MRPRGHVTVMAARLQSSVCRVVVVAVLLIRVATPYDERRQPRSTHPDSELDIHSTDFIFDIGAGRRRLPVAMTAPNVRPLATDEMFRKLGHHFDPERMSVDRPTVLTTSTSGFNWSRDNDDPELVRDLRRLRWTYRDQLTGADRRLSGAVVAQLERWLLDLARCEVVYTWHDMGDLFWPRWVRHGRCDSLAVCSWPPGMYCAPVPSLTLRLLHWQCRRHRQTTPRRLHHRVIRDQSASTGPVLPSRPGAHRHHHRHAQRNGGRQTPLCRWKRVPYPVTSECFCSC